MISGLRELGGECRSHELGARWRPWNKGGGFSPYYRDTDLVVDWDEGLSTYRGYTGTIYRPDVRPANLEYFFRPGLTWVYRGHRLCVQAMPAGTAISTRGNGLYGPEAMQLFDLGLLNSSVADWLIKLSLGRGGHPQFDIGDVSTVPVPEADNDVSTLARQAWSLMRSLDACNEGSHAFTLPALLQNDGGTLAERASAEAERLRATNAELRTVQARIDERCFELYGIAEEDRRAIAEGFGGNTARSEAEDNTGVDDETDDQAEADSAADPTALAAELVSWAVGVAFGRFDIRMATGDRLRPHEPEPFDPLPVCSPPCLPPTMAFRSHGRRLGTHSQSQMTES